MDENIKKLISNLKRQTYRRAKRELMYRYKKYTGYCSLFSSIENDGIRKVYDFIEKDAAAYMAPAVLSFAGCKLTPYTLKNKVLDYKELPSVVSVVGDAVNASILHAIRILLDRTSFYMHTAYSDCEIGNGIGSMEPSKKTGVMKFVDGRLKSTHDLSEEERTIFNYILKEHDEWFHKVIQVDNKTKHNLSAYDLYNMGVNVFPLPPILFPSSKGYYNNRELTEEKEIPVDFETSYISRAYDLFDKILEFTTSIIITR